MFDTVKKDLNAAMERDPSAKSKLEVILTFSGFHALVNHRIAHWFYNKKMVLIAKALSQLSRFFTGIEIHPAAKIGKGVFIDHGMGVVIGETAVVGDNVLIYQGVTLGGTGKQTGKRHPTILNNVMVSAGAKVLGNITIGEYSKIGAGSVVLKDIPPYSTVVGIPGKVVKQFDNKVNDLDQKLPDPVFFEIQKLKHRLETLENQLETQTGFKPEHKEYKESENA